MTFDKWMLELQRTAIEDFGFGADSHAASSMTIEAPEAEEWREFYNDGLSPKEALLEDFRNG